MGKQILIQELRRRRASYGAYLESRLVRILYCPPRQEPVDIYPQHGAQARQNVASRHDDTTLILADRLLVDTQ
ncbi:unnamed protein product [Pararhodospirillum photometricum DSM 122]|uniref:Uncharacterized protein n=1 Tax=Pararhodospirillum photometricum DSM 122 TaxID=1150469 RepID=H6SM06_PARPM|nr:unnamed protein product [Pararhodospirillum photometricum DSM 122]CCG09021.1 unnamed protein product [Pararhodospirillum photometricum DSM 122]